MNAQDLLQSIIAVDMPDVFNPWRQSDPMDVEGFGPFARAVRLGMHFTCKPKFLLIGEAPGYQGCRFSGVPFTNEKLLLEGRIPRIECPARFTTRGKPWSEPSATIVWGTLHELGIAGDVVMWNAFAWHPYAPGEPYSNRAPSKSELAAGSWILRAVVEHFQGAKVVAVGNKSRNLLEWIGVWDSACVRHPSMGGANAFRSGMAEVVARAKP